VSASPTLAATIAAYVARSGSQPLRESTRQAAKAVLLHNLVVGLAAHGRPLPGLPQGQGLPWVQQPTTAPDLAFATSLQMGARAQHDEHPSSVTHLGSAVIPACLAIAPAGIVGSRLLSAIAAGYQVGGVLGHVLLPHVRDRGMRATGVVGPIAAAAAAASVQKLDEAAMAQAISLAVNRAAGYTQVWHSGTDEWRLQTAAAARDGLESALWAAGGARGAAAALEGVSGLLHALGADNIEPAQLAEALAGPPVIEQMLLKAHPVCAINQAAVEVAIDLRAHAAIEAGQIVSVTVRLADADAAYPGIDVPLPPGSWSQAMMDARQGVAVALADGRVEIDALHPGSVEAQWVRQRVVVLGGMPGGGGHGAEIVIELTDGRHLEGRAERVEVDGERSAQMAAELLPAAGISDALAARLPAFVDAIDEPDGVRRLVTAMTGIEPWASLCSR